MTKKKNTMLLIYSGGMDSTVLLYEYRNQIARCISFNYGALHNEKEIEYAEENCARLGIRHNVIDITTLMPYLGCSALLKNSNEEIPDGHYEDATMKKTVVPFRNGIMLSIACAIAEADKLKTVCIANHKGDRAIYPDCREEFINSMDLAMSKGTYQKIELFAPYTQLTKKEIAERWGNRNIGLDEGDLSLKSWSCYKGRKVHCGKCGTCIERKEALEGKDNTVYDN